jgi:hypothetical protein
MVTVGDTFVKSKEFVSSNLGKVPEKSSSSHDTMLDMNLISSLDITSNNNTGFMDDMPLLISDHDLSDCETNSNWSLQKSTGGASVPSYPSVPTLSSQNHLQSQSITPTTTTDGLSPGCALTTENLTAQVQSTTSKPATNSKSNPKLTSQEFKHHRQQLMIILVKYIATKIQNSFPPDEVSNKKELPLEKFLLILTSRLRLSLPMFMKGIIYLFRYMDIIYLLRYLNQSNNFANYNSMDFELKKLIIGCFKLAICREKKLISLKNSSGKVKLHDPYNYDWNKITGLSTQEMNMIVKRIISRMNGKLMIKNIELIKMKSEMYRFVKMIQ